MRICLLGALRLLPFLVAASVGCTGTLFEAIGTQFAAPVAVAVDQANQRAYVVNSNSNLGFADATLSILDLTDPAAPTLLGVSGNPVPIPNFSGQIYFDPATRTAYLTNRLSEDAADTTDSLIRINLDEASAGFGTIETFADGEDPFGIACCDPNGRLYVPANGTLRVFDPADLATSVGISLALTLASGEEASGSNSTEVALLGNQAFVTNRAGRIYVINTLDVGDTSKNPIDYILLNGTDFRGIATDGTSLLVVDEGGGSPVLRILNPATLTAVDPDTSAISEVDIASIQTTSFSLGSDPNEVIVWNGRAYVTNRGSDTVSVIDLASNTVATTITVSDEPFGLAAATIGGTDYLYVTNLASNSLSIIELASNAVVNTFAP